MPDREKCVGHLNDCMEASRRDNTWVFVRKDIVDDAIALLKEQEEKTVESIRTVAYRTLGYCPSCGRGLDSYHDGNSGDHITHFCYNCGQAVKWE